ncbi:MAG: pyridoxine 5'-phosphate synthase [bacterium]|nr:pyridoxine 5'-phosphate synthase [bacterium]
MIRLAVNIDHIATIREARGGLEPDPVHAAVLAELAGASGIVCHLREDRRHVNDRDVRVLRDVVGTKLDLEMAATESILAIALDVVPDLVTFVPEQREELTTEGGLNVAANCNYLGDAVSLMSAKGIQVSFFIEPERAQVDAAARCGAGIIELHTGKYATARTHIESEAELTRLRTAAEHAVESGLLVTAGHGLDYRNIGPICSIPQLEEVSIGHSIIARAALVGIDRAVREMIDLLRLFSAN